jgi:hypothetical protein
MGRLKERLISKKDEIGNNGLSTRNGDVDGFILFETGNNRHFVYIYNSEIDEVIEMLKKRKDPLAICKSKGKNKKTGNSAQARELSQMEKPNKNVSNKEAERNV